MTASWTETQSDDPWAADHHLAGRIQLALSILGHAEPTDLRTRQAIDRAVLALQGKSIDEIREATS